MTTTCQHWLQDPAASQTLTARQTGWNCPWCEIEQLRASLGILRNCMLRMTCKTPEVVHLRREDWDRAFAPLIVPPYNLLRWEQSSEQQKGSD